MSTPFRFPPDLLALERAWLSTYAHLAQAPATAGTTVLRRRLITLSGRLCTHPHWDSPTAWRAGRVELRRAARTPAPAERNERSMREQTTTTPCPTAVQPDWTRSRRAGG